MSNKIKITIDNELRDIAKTIIKQNWSIDEWAKHEANDWFKTNNYEGGFDATENEFCFSWHAPSGQEFWFQFPLSLIPHILDGNISEIDAIKADHGTTS